MITDCLLMVFVKNIEAGKVKTRLAKTLGNEKSIEIYRLLLSHTLHVAKALECDKIVYYSEKIEENDTWHASGFQQGLQTGSDLGEKMFHAFEAAFANNYKKVVIIGSDCLDLSVEILASSFNHMEENEACIGPALDGGFYLMGLRAPYKEMFLNKQWSTALVLEEAKNCLAAMNIKLNLLTVLGDIDEEADWNKYNKVGLY